ncbi:TPA: hypothetical protein ACMDRY_003623 [Vibrio cholerae]|uniref:hypothetical protein n=1 Tax=Vibrio cholerae TaxID=666 RepID=UPI000E0C738F|nr:hypothetical protein [Vibrio cholerae]MBJ6915164.1 hypothetical protein [Vibrio cholerae]MBJ6918913.1 hypothetical protein [Vibrio cholerae]MBJ6930376.1 hypothetical protein [Vibrio cholerae]MBJ6938114.1 hypothetical protein [Vibrio cholerae]MBJ6965950.1 hypothetical protein [Vibrio cholerae]
MKDWVLTALLVLGMTAALAAATWFVLSVVVEVIEDYYHRKALKQFKDDLHNALKYSQPTWGAISDIAETRGLSQSEIQMTIRRTVRDVLTGQEEELKPHLELLNSYTKEYKEVEPFENLPSDIRLPLERIREQLEDQALLEPLTSHIKQLVELHSKENKRQKFYTAGGFFIGLLGILLAVIFYMTPLTATESLEHEQEGKPVEVIEG